MHAWKSGGSDGRWVGHTSTGKGSDNIGVGIGENVLGPFSQRMAVKLADALNNAYEAGKKDGKTEALTEAARNSQALNDDDGNKLDSNNMQPGDYRASADAMGAYSTMQPDQSAPES